MAFFRDWILRLKYLLFAMYSVSLLMASIPITGNNPLARTHLAFETFFHRALIVPGLKLFYRPYSDRNKLRHECIQYFGMNSDGAPERLFQTDLCDREVRLRLFEDPYQIMFHRLIEDAAMERMAEAARQKLANPFTNGMVPTGRELTFFQAQGDFFCRNNNKMKTIELLWSQEVMAYPADQHTWHPILRMEWNCLTNSIDLMEWLQEINTQEWERFSQ